MKPYYISLTMQDDSMTCGMCTDTVTNLIGNYCAQNNIFCDNIAADYHTQIVQFKLILEEDISKSDDEVTLNAIISNIKSELGTIGFDCVADHVSEGLPKVQITTPRNHTVDLMFASTSLGLGITVMLADHMEWMPASNNDTDKAINYAVGSVATLITLFMGKSIFKKAWKAKAQPSTAAMDVLITAGIFTAIIDSYFKLAFPSFFEDSDESTYFSLPLIVLGIIKFSHAIRDIAYTYIEKDMGVIDEQWQSLPDVARVVVTDEEEQKYDNAFLESNFAIRRVDDVSLGSTISVKPNEIVPIDGSLVNATNEITVAEATFGKQGSTLKKEGDIIFAGAKNQSDAPIYLETICEGDESAMRLAYDAIRMNKTSLAKDTVSIVSHYFLKAVIGIATISAFAWGVFGPDVTYAPQVFLSVLLSACPCAFGFIDVGTSVTKLLAYEYGILMRNESAFSMHKVTDFCFDKCGTLTSGAYALENIYIPNDANAELKDHYLSLAVALQNEIIPTQRSAVGDALINAFGNKPSLACASFENNAYNPGRGGKGIVNNQEIIIGNKHLLERHGITFDCAWLKIKSDFSSSGKLPIFLAVEKKVKCAFVLGHIEEKEQALRYGVPELLFYLLKSNINLHVLTGDSSERTHFLLTDYLEDYCIDIKADLCPKDKLDVIDHLKGPGKLVAMLGDEENDRPAIQHADIGIAIDVDVPAIQDADVVLNGSFLSLAQVIYLARMHDYYLKVALGIAFGMNGIAIMAAAGALYPFTGELVHPIITMGVMATSSLLLLLSVWGFREVEKRQMNTLMDAQSTLFQPISDDVNDTRESLSEALLLSDFSCH